MSALRARTAAAISPLIATLLVLLGTSGLDAAGNASSPIAAENGHGALLVDANAGATAFSRHCALCHGHDAGGAGPVARFLLPPPRDFVRDDVRIRSGPEATPNDIAATIARGIPGTAMPAFPNLSLEERLSIAEFLLGIPKRGGTAAVAPSVPALPPDTGARAPSAVAAAGLAAYEKGKCALCHGESGRGDGPITEALVAEWGSPFAARDLTRGDLFKAGNSAEDVFRTLATGFPGTPMASYAEILTETERADLARHVAALSGKAIPRTARVDEGVSEKRGQWVFAGKGRCVGCHRAAGIGDGDRGPDLAPLSEPGVAASRRPGIPAERYVVESILDPSAFVVEGYSDDVMPRINREAIFLDRDEVASLAAFLLGAGAAGRAADAIARATDEAFAAAAGRPAEPEPPGGGDPVRGHALYFDKEIGCASCHAILGRDEGQSDVGPDLSFMGAIQSRRQIRKSIAEPNAAIVFGYDRVGIETEDGDVFVGFPLADCGGEKRLRDGLRARAFAPAEIAAVHGSIDSSMPANLRDLLGDASEKALADLVAFLENPLAAMSPAASRGAAARIEAPLERRKPAPPLAGLASKTTPRWLRAWLANPKDWDEHAKMPDPGVTPSEIEDIVAFLWTAPGEPIPKSAWPAWASKKEEDLSDEEFAEAEATRARGKALFQAARCRLCHSLGGKGGETGLGPPLDGIATETNLDWLDRWLEDPRALFPDTAMPRFRFTEEERRDLVLYVATDFEFVRDGFPADGAPAAADAASVRRGRDLVTVQRCAACHDVPGIEVLGRRAAPAPAKAEEEAGKKEDEDPFVTLANDARCLSCHAIEGRGGTYAPDLSNAGRRLKREWVEPFLLSPDVIRLLSQQMPRLFLSPEEARVAADFVSTRLRSGDMGDLAAPGEPARGEALYGEKACRACHQIGSQGGALGPELTRAGARLEPGAIVDLLIDPRRFVPLAPKPRLGLTQREAEHIAAWVASLGAAAPTEEKDERDE